MSWFFEPARAGFERHAAEWDDLNREHGNHVLLDSRFVGSLVRCFATPTTLLATSARPAARGFALLEPGRAGFVSTFQPSQSPLGLILLESSEAALPMTRELIRHWSGYALGISVLQQDPDYTVFPAERLDAGAERVEYIDTGRVKVQGSFEQYWAERSKNLKHNLHRQRRRLSEQGRSLEFDIILDPARAAESVAEYGRLEGSGWKAAQGTAVTAENLQGEFYRTILGLFLARGEAAVFQLRLDGRIIASDLCLERGGMMVILKTAYATGVEGLSPGLLLHHEILAHCFDTRRVRVVEFYGRVRDWHTKWTQDIRRMYHVNVCRNRWIARTRAIARKGMNLLCPERTR